MPSPILPPPSLGESADEVRGQRGAHGEQRRRETGEAVRAEHLPRQQGAHRDSRGQARAAEDLADDDDGERPSLHPPALELDGVARGKDEAGITRHRRLFHEERE